MNKKRTREQLIKLLASISQVTLNHSDTCSSGRNGECYCALGDRNELRTEIRETLKAESPRLASEIEALESVEAARAAYNAAHESQRRIRQEESPDFAAARQALHTAQLRLNKARSTRD